MNYCVRFTLRAQADLTDLFDYLFPRAGEKTAQAFVEKIYRHCCSFDRFPERGTKRDDMRQGLRLVGFHRYASIAFTVVGHEVIILRIFMRGEDVDDDFE